MDQPTHCGQQSLFDEHTDPVVVPVQVGRSKVSTTHTKTALTRASGFMSSYNYTLNPYSGCTFGCSYCYAAFFASSDERQADWGNWVEVKTNTLEVLRRMRTDLRGKTVYMSSVTDPYQPVERHLGLVRELLIELLNRGVRLVVQTRSTLVVRDIDLLQQFEHVRVNMTVSTDSRRVQKVFEPKCPSPNRRLRAISEVHSAGIKACITMTPLLPIENPTLFVSDLQRTGIEHFVVQPFHTAKGRFVAGTQAKAFRLIDEMGWTDDDYRRIVTLMRTSLPRVDEGREGFAPE